MAGFPLGFGASAAQKEPNPDSIWAESDRPLKTHRKPEPDREEIFLFFYAPVTGKSGRDADLAEPERSPTMSRTTFLIALLGLALFAGCNQSDGSGSEWVCASYVGEEPTSVYLEWSCESRTDWDECQFKYLTADIEDVDYFCEEDFVGTLANGYTCLDRGDHRWSCQTLADRQTCEANYFENPEDLYWCNSAFNAFDETPIYWACPDPAGNYAFPTADRKFACPRAEPTPPCCERTDNEAQEQYQVSKESEDGCAECRGGTNDGTACYNFVLDRLDNSFCTGGGQCVNPANSSCRRQLNQELRAWNRTTNANLNPGYAKSVPPECTFVGNDECTPIWNLDNGLPANNCNPRAGCVLR